MKSPGRVTDRRPWASLAELARDPGRLEAASREFAAGEDEAPGELLRRDFMRAMGAALAAGGLEGCARAPAEKIVPYAAEAPEARPGTPSFYATAMVTSGLATGLLVESHEGRPTKIEGNPAHPASLGAAGAIAHASILGLYDPSRARAVLHDGAAATWRELEGLLRAHAADRGRGLHLVLEATGSPALEAQLARLRAALPEHVVHWDPGGAPSRRAAWDGARIALGRVLEAQIDLRVADVVVSLDADFLTTRPDSLRLTRHLAERRRVRGSDGTMSRLYVAESALTVTGASADHRLPLKSGAVLALAAALLAAVVGEIGPRGAEGSSMAASTPAIAVWQAHAGDNARWIGAVARDLVASRGRSVVVAGPGQPAAVHAIAHALNAALGNFGRTVTFTASPILEAGEASHDPARLPQALDAGEVDTLLVLGGNPVYTAPRDLDLAARFRRARASVYLGAHATETAAACAWLVPEAHFLETWGDARAFDGTRSIVQPLVAPLEAARTAGDVLAAILDDARGAHERLLGAWREGGGTEASFRAALQRGVVEGTALPAVVVTDVAWPAIAKLAILPAPDGIEITLRPDARVGDGAHANNAWLQELPDPITKLTWGNAALVSPRTAAALGVETGDVVVLARGDVRVRAPALVVPGQADASVALALGYGRQGSEALAEGVGFDAGALRSLDAAWIAPGITVTPAMPRVREELAITQRHVSLEGRDDEVLRHRTLAEHRNGPEPGAGSRTPRSLYVHGQDARRARRQWGMVIDLAACTGCSACVVACQSENNVPVVGRTGVLKGREMHWLRIDRYFLGEPAAPEVLVQPMLCQHCEKAPCEYVCPVNATTHSQDGLNEMTYNRCVGTRFCSNNCPYKVRRFNWFDYHRGKGDADARVMNPDVTVRARGVMEKCTYCVQRIREAEIREKVRDQPLRDGDVRTACQDACPAGAIVFGDIEDRTSGVARLRADPRAYGALEDLGVRPRTQYMARLRNPNPELT